MLSFDDIPLSKAFSEAKVVPSSGIVDNTVLTHDISEVRSLTPAWHIIDISLTWSDSALNVRPSYTLA